MVYTTSAPAISSSGTVKMSLESTVISASFPGVSDRTGLIGLEPADMFLPALAHQAGYLERTPDPLNAMLRRVALRSR